VTALPKRSAALADPLLECLVLRRHGAREATDLPPTGIRQA
jgi:hypothetical protein